ncbi:MAG: hypothetical protein ACRCSG_02630 [Cellulosilyticaceae bacterium]
MKRKILEAILELTKKQSEALANDDLELFEVLMQKKQLQIDAMEELHKTKPETKEQKEEILFKEIIECDKKNKEEFMRQFDETKTKLADIRMQKRRETLYGNVYGISNEEGIFIDKR